MAYFLPPGVEFFPHPLKTDEDGLLAMGASIDADTLLLAYQFGIFPWSNEGEPTFWYYTHPRCVLYPTDVRVTKSMRPYLNGNRFRWSLDTAFPQVIRNCKQIKRNGQNGTWLYDRLEDTFLELHQLGLAHSVEVWEGEELVGGLYGLALGNIFFGESMFAKVSNASKYGFIQLCRWLDKHGFTMVDCQQRTQHMLSMGAETISKEAFMKRLRFNVFESTKLGPWTV